jgi:RecA-family ATPase
MYVNLELDRASCLRRFKDVYQALDWNPENIRSIDVWNLRGKAVPMDKLAPKLIRRAAKKGYIAIVIDPIYKVITGDENSADQMAKFCNQFDVVCAELGAAVIYCHHHSKGSQGQKRTADRASGSGVFARDPDALLDYIELETTDALLKQEENKVTCQTCIDFLNQFGPADWGERVSQDDKCKGSEMESFALREIGCSRDLIKSVEIAKERVRLRTAWRIDGTLREFPKMKPVNVWFDHPVHYMDDVGSLGDLKSEGERMTKAEARDRFKQNGQERQRECNEGLEEAFCACNFGDPPTIQQLSEYLEITERAVQNRVRKHPNFYYDKNEKTIKRTETEEVVHT